MANPPVAPKLPIYVNPSNADLVGLAERTGQELIGVRVGPNLYVTSGGANAGHVSILNRIGVGQGTTHNRLIFSLKAGGGLNTIDVPVLRHFGPGGVGIPTEPPDIKPPQLPKSPSVPRPPTLRSRPLFNVLPGGGHDVRADFEEAMKAQARSDAAKARAALQSRAGGRFGAAVPPHIIIDVPKPPLATEDELIAAMQAQELRPQVPKTAIPPPPTVIQPQKPPAPKTGSPDFNVNLSGGKTMIAPPSRLPNYAEIKAANLQMTEAIEAAIFAEQQEARAAARLLSNVRITPKPYEPIRLGAGQIANFIFFSNISGHGDSSSHVQLSDEQIRVSNQRRTSDRLMALYNESLDRDRAEKVAKVAAVLSDHLRTLQLLRFENDLRITGNLLRIEREQQLIDPLNFPLSVYHTFPPALDHLKKARDHMIAMLAWTDP